MTRLGYPSLLVILMVLNSMITNGKTFLTCDSYATSSTCSGPSWFEDQKDCDTCCNRLLERMFNCPSCRHFVLSHRRQGSSCFCTVCFKRRYHRRRHQYQQDAPNDFPSRFDV